MRTLGHPASAFSFPVPFGRSSGGCDVRGGLGAQATNVVPAGVGHSSGECGLAGPACERLGRLEIERAARDAAGPARERLARLNERRRSCGMAVPRANGSARPAWSRPPAKSGRPPRERLGPLTRLGTFYHTARARALQRELRWPCRRAATLRISSPISSRRAAPRLTRFRR